jgi:hypothetical protein
MSQVDYEVAGREAHLYELGDEFLRVELYDGYFSAAWTTPLQIAAVLESLESVLPDLAGEAVLFDVHKREHERLVATEAVERLLANDADVSFARFELSGVTVVWERPADTVADISRRPAELALIARVFDEDTFLRMLRATGSEHVALDADLLVDRLAYVAEHVGRGHLASKSVDRRA